MFLDELEPDQKSVFLGIAKRMALSDWNISVEEEEAITRIREEVGGWVSAKVGDLVGNDGLVRIVDPSHRVLFLFELHLFAMADLKIDKGELYVLDDIARELEIPEQSVAAVRELIATENLSVRTSPPQETRAAVRRALREIGG